MWTRLICTIAAFSASFALTTVAASAQETVVRTQSGRVVGVRNGEVDAFKGIPFAAAPVGDLRWRAPQPAPRWSRPRQAVDYGSDCQQTPFPGDAAPSAAPFAEDCLYLNVWRPAQARRPARLPVMVWIHGGGFVNGGSSPEIYSGDGFARDGVVYVSFNYRLGRFGFFAHPALNEVDPVYGGAGNFGLMDQVAALRWIRDNIANFGGDPNNVTIMGESAGGASVLILLTSPLAEGLFHRAIVQSGGGRTTAFSNRSVTTDAPNAPSLRTLGVAFAERNGIHGTDAAAAAALRALPAASIDNGLSMASMQPQRETYGGPSIDGRIAVGPMETLLNAQQFARVPTLVGATNSDLGFMPATTKQEAFAMFRDRAAEAQAIYDPNGDRPDREVISAIASDIMMAEPARFIASRLDRGADAYLFRFSYVAEALRDRVPGALHASDIPYALNTLDDRTPENGAATANDQAVARVMHQYWVNFARNGDPNGEGLPVWPSFDDERQSMVDFAATGQAVPQPDPWRARMDIVCTTFAPGSCPTPSSYETTSR